MESSDRVEPHYEADQADGAEVEGPAAGALISANLAGVNTGLSTAATGAPSAGNLGGVSGEQAAEVVGEDGDNPEVGELKLDALDDLGRNRPATGDEGVSRNQSELEAGEMNG
jgi:hypothetical protein